MNTANEKLKYNVGDKVLIVDDIEFLTNPYHYEWYLKHIICTVEYADKKYFSVYKDAVQFMAADKNYIAGCNECLLNFQATGKQWSWPKPKTLLHLVKDKRQICDLIDAHFQSCFDKKMDETEKEIKKLQARIDFLKSKDNLSWLKDRKADIITLINKETKKANLWEE